MAEDYPALQYEANLTVAGFRSCRRGRPWRPACPLLLLLLLCGAARPSRCEPELYGYRPRDVNRNTENGVFVVYVGESATLELYGAGFTNATLVKFTDNQSTTSAYCLAQNSNLFGVRNVAVNNDTTIMSIDITGTFDSINSRREFYFCLFDGVHPLEASGVYQGNGSAVTVIAIPPPSPLIPLPVEIILIFFLMILSGLFSGLNLGLMALDPTTLKIIMESGSKKQRGYARTIYRVRRHGNYLLCTLLLGNVLVNSTLTVLLDSVLGNGVFAVVASTMAIVIFGEIIPQAICSRHGLFIGAHTIWLTYIFMVLTLPLALPISLVLNLILGKEIGSVYNREQLLELLKIGKHDLEHDEVNIISGALEFKKKTVEDVMTKYSDVYCLNMEAVLDFKTMRDIYESGFSRIPVFEGDQQNVVGLLYVRDLAFVDPDDEIPLTNILKFYDHEVKFVYHDLKLGELLQEFSEGRCHMAVVQQVVSDTETDPFYEVIGVVTLEDIVEEILQREIVDETDRFMDNRTRKPRQCKQVNLDEFEGTSATPTLSSQQQLAVFQFLCSGVEPFKEDYISHNVLKRLLRKVMVQTVSIEQSRSTGYQLFTAGKPASYFALILEGCMEVQIGRDGLSFESRSFSHFGAQGLLDVSLSQQSEYLPDFTAQPVTECQILIITHRQYLAACKATKFERETREGEAPDWPGPMSGDEKSVPDVFAEEWAQAETGDMESSQNTASGLSQISRFLYKPDASRSLHKRSKRTEGVSGDHSHLLSGSSSSYGSTSSDGPESARPAPHHRTFSDDFVPIPPPGGLMPRPSSDNGVVMLEMESVVGMGEGRRVVREQTPPPYVPVAGFFRGRTTPPNSSDV